MAALWNTAPAGHHNFAMQFLLLPSSIFFPRLISAAADWMSATWYGLSANLRRRSETCCTRLTENTGCKNSPKIAIWAPSHNYVGLYLCN